MRKLLILILIAGAGWAQGPVIGSLELYGRRKASEEAIFKAAGVKVGDPLPRSKGDVEDAIIGVSPVVNARLQAVCCDQRGEVILYIGLEERGTPHFDYRLPPEGTTELPAEIMAEYDQYLVDLAAAARAGETSEDWSAGHAFMDNAAVRRHQERFAELASANLTVLRQVLRSSADDGQREAAAYVIGYAPKDKIAVIREVIADLQFALRDPDDSVRGNAVRALGAIAVMAALNPEMRITVSPTWFIEMLDSLIWNDKMAAARTLLILSDSRESALLARIAERADSLAEMASWKNLPHALPAFILLGRSYGAQEKEIQDAWASSTASLAIQRWRSKPKR